MATLGSDDVPSTRPYLIRALHEWCSDNGFTPYLAVAVDDSVQVPREFVKDNEIVLNASFDATSHLTLGNDFIEFKARFGGVPREVVIPVDHVIAVYARENGQGMAFPAPVLQPNHSTASAPSVPTLQVVSSEGLARAEGGDDDLPPDEPTPPSRPTLKRVK
jgi:stringent starvation protein B